MKITICEVTTNLTPCWYVYIDGADMEPLVIFSLDELPAALEAAGFVLSH